MPVDVWGLDGLTLDGAETRRADAAMVMAVGNPAPTSRAKVGPEITAVGTRSPRTSRAT